MSKIQTVRGTRDILPGEAESWQKVERTTRETLELYGFREIRTPIFEATDLFARGIGESTDIVHKEMYTFVSGDDSITLRPEMTASVVRAYIQHGLSRLPGSERLYYIGPMFRRERPQKGRQRQFHQIGVEVFGEKDPYVDAETIEMALALLRRLGIGGTSLLINSVGCNNADCRPRYRDLLRRSLEAELGELCEDCRRRYRENPLRVFDCKIPADRERIARLPTPAASRCAECESDLVGLQERLTDLGIRRGEPDGFEIDERLVRGLDYYVRAAFEIVSSSGLGAQNSLMGGGRYDGLVKELGGPDVAGFGWAMGMERLMILLGTPTDGPAAAVSAAGCDLFIAHLGEEARRRAFSLGKELRALGLSVRLDPRSAKLAAQMKKADREGARFAILIGDVEISSGIYQLKDMRTGEQQPVEAATPVSIAERIRRARENG